MKCITMMMIMMMIMLLLLPSVTLSFNWGSNCMSGSDTKHVKLTKNTRSVIGVIPIGVYNPRIMLKSVADLDIVVRVVSSGESVISWPSGKLNAPNVCSVNFGPLQVQYSGYNGGQTVSTVGNEYVNIYGTMHLDLEISAFAYAAGQGNVSYSWSASKCCCNPTRGTFMHHTEKDSHSVVGAIVTGKRNIKINLKSEHDLDIQLTDTSDNKKIIGWAKLMRDAGILHSGKRECTVYKSVRYCYSGYDGQGGHGGHESIEIHGTTNVPLVMSVYGYKGGVSNVTYEHIDGCCPTAFTFDIENEVSTTHHTQNYKAHMNSMAGRAVLIVRRNGMVRFRSVEPVLIVRAIVGGVEIAVFNENDDHQSFHVIVPSLCAVGSLIGSELVIWYRHQYEDVSGAPIITSHLAHIHCLFNAWDQSSPVYLSDESLRIEYVTREDGRFFHGDVLNSLSDGIFSHAWLYQQGELFPIVLKVLAKYGHPQGFTNALDATRVLSRILNNANEENAGLMHGRWHDDYGDGKVPTHWSDSRQILHQWSSNSHKPVKYVQCWVFASIYVTFARALGIPCTQVTNFRSAHGKPPYNGIVEQLRKESIWNFHVVNQVFVNNKSHITDSTPQELSDGAHQMGPANVADIVAHRLNKAYDVGFAIEEFDGLMWTSKQPYNASRRREYKSGVHYNETSIGRFVSTLTPGCTGDGTHCRKDITCDLKRVGHPLCVNTPSNHQPRFVSLLSAPTPLWSCDIEHSIVSAGEKATFLLNYDGTSNDSVHIQMDAYVVAEDGSSGTSCQHCFIDECVGPPRACKGRTTATTNTAHPPADEDDDDRVEHGTTVDVAHVGRTSVVTTLPNGTQKWKLSVDESKYSHYLCNARTLQMRARVLHKTSGQVLFEGVSQVTLKSPVLEVYSSCSRPRTYEKIQLGIRIRNPFHFKLTKLDLNVNTAGFVDQNLVYTPQTIGAHETVILKTRPFSLDTPGKHVITITLATCEYNDIVADVTIPVGNSQQFRQSPDHVCTDAL